jgi:hypothetical protein
MKASIHASTMATTLARILAALMAGGIALQLTRSHGVIAASLISSLLIAGSSVVIGKASLTAAPRWALIGGTAGAILGTAEVLSGRLQELDPGGGSEQRAVVMALLASAGIVGGLMLSRDAAANNRRHPRDVLKAVSGLTTGLFATLVALDYLHQGLDPARTFSSRLSTALTILVATLTVPGWMAHTLAHPTWRAARATTPGERTTLMEPRHD